MKEKTVEACVFWVLVFAVYFVLVQTNGCSDHDTTVIRPIEIIESHHGKGHNKDCRVVIDSLEALLEECQK